MCLALFFLCSLYKCNSNFYYFEWIVAPNKFFQRFQLFKCSICERNCECIFLRASLNDLFFFTCYRHSSASLMNNTTKLEYN